MKREILDVPTMAKMKIVAYYAQKGRPLPYDVSDMFVVWSCKTLQNWKTIISFAAKGAPLFEVTHDGTHDRTYVDVYAKIDHHIVAGSEM